MGYNYPLTIPNTVSYSSVTFGGHCVTAKQKSEFSLKETVFRHSGQEWLLSITFPPMTPAQFRPYQAFLMALKGDYGTFMWGDPLMSLPEQGVLGNPEIRGSNQIGEEINTKGWTAFGLNVLKAGDFLQIGNNLHMNLQDVNANGSGWATLDIFPKLRTSFEDGENIILNSPKGIFRLAENQNFWTMNKEKNYELTITAVEALI